ncbi:condensation domain-containing protein [Streptomyces sp. NPDC048191]|uniref:condensation domain-containing protein n=1 Tax=Streptomyces sp. NPDC048191 TaxID=3155484 RepID=UPI0033CF9E75
MTPGTDGRSRELDSGPLSSVQLRMWLLEELGLGGSSYMIDYALRVRGDVSLNSLRRSLNTVFQHHAILRTRYRRVGEDVVQVVLEEELTVLETDFTLDDATPLADQLWTAARTVRRPLDGDEPPFYVQLLKLAADDVIVLMSSPHISLDGTSLRVLRDELLALLEADRDGRPAPPTETAGQTYLAYARRQRARADLDAADRAYWTARLDGLNILPLPTDFPRPPRFSGAGDSVMATVPALVAENLRFLGQRLGASPHMVYLALFMLGLSRLTGQSDIAVGIPLSDRTEPGMEGVLGCFVETVVIRTDVAEHPTFGQLVAAVRDAVLEAMEHPRLPFGEIIARNGVRDPSSHPVYQVMFTYEEQGRGAPEVRGLRVEELSTGPRSAKADLSMHCAEQGDRSFVIWINYPFSLFKPQTVEAFARRLASLARSISRSPDAWLGGLDRQAVDSGPGARPETDGTSVLGLMADAAADDPDRTALVTEGGRVSYGDLGAAVSKYVQRLPARTRGPYPVVDVASDDIRQAVVDVLGSWRSGRVFRLPDAGHRASATTTTAAADPAAGRTGERLRPEGGSPVCLVVADSGVQWAVGRTAFESRIREQARALGLEAGEELLLVSSAVTAHSLLAVLAAFTAGATVVVTDVGRQDPGEDPNGALKRHRPSAVYAESADALNGLAALDVLEGWRSLRVLCTEDDPLPARTLRKIESRTSARVYGTVGAGAGRVHFAVAGSTAHVRAGARVLADVAGQDRVHLLDRELQAVAVGEAGDLHVSGPSLSSGIAGHAALTAERFLPDPHPGRPGARMYATGLVGRWTPEGLLEILGHRDRRLFLHGFLVNLDEVEAALGTHPSVGRVSVTVTADDDAVALQADVTPLPGSTPTSADQLQAYLGSLLPLPMIPRSLHVNGAGAARRGLASEPSDVARLLVPRLQEIWAQCLSLDEVGPDTDFFWAGGHSLIASLIIGKVAGLLPDVHVPADAVFERPVFADFAELMARLVEDKGLDPASGGAPAHGVFDPLIRLRPGTGPTSVFCVHPVGGLSWCYRALLPFIDGVHPVVGLQSSRPAAMPPHSSMEEMASDYVSLIRSVQPRGPYILLGWSFGGTLAQEIAVRLQEGGDRIALLVLFDAAPAVADDLPGVGADTVTAVTLAQRNAVPGGDADETVRIMEAATRNNALLQRRFTTRRFAGSAHHFEAVLSTERWGPLAEKWSPFIVGGVRNHPIRCDHDAMMDSAATAQLGPILAELIGDAPWKTSQACGTGSAPPR